MFEYDRSEDRLTLRRPGTRWLSNGFDGGYIKADAAHNLTVPEGFDRTDLAAYTTERLGSRPDGPVLLTGVRQTHARGARYAPIEAVATAGLSNPARLPLGESAEMDPGSFDASISDAPEPGTVNLLLGSSEPLSEGGLAGMLATAVEAKTATLLEIADCTGTTSDAVAVGCPLEGTPAAFAGSATGIGNATRVCVRDAITAALGARYDDGPPDPETATHGTVTAGSATIFQP